MNRNQLIAYAYRYEGEYFKILNALKRNEEVQEIDCTNAITILDEDYPSCFLDLKYPPLILFYKGNLNLLKEEKIAIVGSRNACDYAIDATKKLVRANIDKVIVSGLAKGIDGVAHRCAIKTIGVLGCGIDMIYPKENADLFYRIEQEGLLLSEYPQYTKPLAYHFPFRNRIIAALSNPIYIMQSSKRSGTVTTINEALELQKEVKVLPYSLNEDVDLYNNELIQEGASIIQKEDLQIDK